MTLSLQALGGAMEIGANCLVVSDGTRSVAIDAGLHPKLDGEKALPAFRSLTLPRPQSIVLTHCHHDHVGAIPVAVRHWKTRVLTSEVNKVLAVRMLRNSANVMRKQAEASASAASPLYTMDDVDALGARMVDLELHRPYTPSGGLPRGGAAVTMRLLPAGHVFGACGIDMNWGDHRIFFTSDTIGHNQHLTSAAELPPRCDTLVMEATLGASPELELLDRTSEMNRFGRACARTLQGGGAVVVPCFALGRTQEMLYTVYQLKRRSVIPADTPVYIGGLGRAVTEIYDAMRFLYPRRDPEFLLRDVDAEVVPQSLLGSRDPLQKPAIFLVTSGMIQAHTPSFTLVQAALREERHAILFVGYCDADADGYPVYMARQGDTIRWRGNTGPQHVACHIEHFRFTAHAKASELVEFVQRMKPDRVFLHHGSPEAIAALTARIRDEYPPCDVEALWSHRVATF